MSWLWLVVSGYVKKPEPALVQHEYLRGERQDAPLSQETARYIESSYRPDRSFFLVVKKILKLTFS
jgi:hypothetical protein